MRLTTCVLTAALVLWATASGRGQAPPHRRDDAIQQLAADAASLPPEFEADVLLRLSGLSRVDKEWRRELLDNAYLRAYAAPEQHRRGTTQQITPDSRQGAQIFAYATALTRVTLQVRAVELMGQWLPRWPSFRSTLEGVASKDSEGKVRDRAKAAL